MRYAATKFAETALRMTLEVLDHRRPPAQLRPVLDAALIDVVRAFAKSSAPARGLGAARLQRIHVRLIDPHTAEVFGTYQRGPRVLALAAQVTLRAQGWRVSAVQIG
ncbi:Rv3235 family protein [Aldersonia sp. NBC_00410]|uniref:Rv3235 family protein n=1 Tax=Aldersonia sp. NBC_00410 TaxID=2975954 RepID=UPI002B1D2859|nr:Rv3235 family protein [Aldersonia sp. NBC_00410]